MMKNKVHAFAPATVANVVSCFDVLGFAVDEPGDEVVLRLTKEPGVVISQITGDNGMLPTDPSENTAGVVALEFLNHIKAKHGVEIELHKKMPLGSGLGSSAASSVASLVAINKLFGDPLSRDELLPFALEGERVACGTAHADNVAPALFGGFVLIRSYDPLDVIKIPAPSKLLCTIIHPQIEIRTEEARKILKKEVTLKAATIQWGNTAGLIAGLMKPDYGLIGRSLQDVIIEPIRSILIPNFEEVKKAALGAGALGCGISGSGPPIFAFSTSQDVAAKVGQVMQKEFQLLKVESEIYFSKINEEGARIIS